VEYYFANGNFSTVFKDRAADGRRTRRVEMRGIL